MRNSSASHLPQAAYLGTIPMHSTATAGAIRQQALEEHSVARHLAANACSSQTQHLHARILRQAAGGIIILISVLLREKRDVHRIASSAMIQQVATSHLPSVAVVGRTMRSSASRTQESLKYAMME